MASTGPARHRICKVKFLPTLIPISFLHLLMLGMRSMPLRDLAGTRIVQMAHFFSQVLDGCDCNGINTKHGALYHNGRFC